VRPARYISLNGGEPQLVDGAVIEEALACITVNGEELATFMCTPRDLTEMALGFLYNEGSSPGWTTCAPITCRRAHVRRRVAARHGVRAAAPGDHHRRLRRRH
jgi:formate dehydrogenase assembly factor FdhD